MLRWHWPCLSEPGVRFYQPERRRVAMTVPQDLLNDLRSSQTDLARIVEAVLRDRLPYVLVPVQAVRSWERREPNHWAKVAGWLAAQNVAVVQV
jgi:hypothetical protein